MQLGACPRMKSLLRKMHFGHILRKFSLNRATIRLKFTQNLPQNDFPSLRLSFSDKLLVAKCGEAGCFYSYPILNPKPRHSLKLFHIVRHEN